MRLHLPNWFKHTELTTLHIGVEGLPVSVSCLEPGRQYAVTVDHPRAKIGLICRTAISVLEQAQSCYILSANPERILEQLRADLHLQTDSSEVPGLQLMKWLPQTARHLQTSGWQAFLYELEQLDLPCGSLLILEDGDELFHHGDETQLLEQMQSFQRWFANWQVAGLFVLQRETGNGFQSPFWQCFSGIVEFAKDLGCYHWMIQHWRSIQGWTLDVDYELHAHSDDSRLTAIKTGSAKTLNDVDDTVYFTIAAIDAEEEGVPDNWVACQDYQQMIERLPELGSATVVLDFHQQSAFAELAQTVHQLRIQGGRQIRIIIRECSGQLRYSQELVLNRLGANQVVYREYGLSRLLRIVESSRGQRFTGQIEDDFKLALVASIPAEECGYLPPAKFCNLVKATLQKTDAIEMHHMLVRLDLLPDKAHLDVLLSCQPRRANDVVTADQAHVYIFIYACRESDLEAALARIVLEPLPQLFSGQSHWSGHRNILDVIGELQEKSRLVNLADFSLLLPTRNVSTVDRHPTDPQPAETAAPVPTPGRQPQRQTPIRRVEPAALRLKNPMP